ncbi:class I SAM-dependent methyltransferase [Falsiroseomonas sp. E2-1-a20]|uniref:class I SAM-dependent methyltransferase n=1 Tax=Falsiroseomonas sp. E2-1-a20 TaxID=3239300 RepID=UPI003F41B03A
MSRVELLLAGASKTSRILEIGPSHAPMAPRSRGWNTTIVDHASRDGLIAKYRDDRSVDTSRIEEVDVVWHDGPLHAAIPAEHHGSFDLLIASHVIEHFPDPIGILRSAEHLLHPTRGRISLAVPDKRSCFDFFRPPSSTGKLLAAHHAQRIRHSPGDIFDTTAYFATLNGASGWAVQPSHAALVSNSLDHAWRAFQDTREQPDSAYQDCHAWVMTPASFELMILEVARTGLIDWHIESVAPQAGVEFLVQMHRGREQFASTEAFEARRLALLRRCVADLHEWTTAMLGETALPLPLPRQGTLAQQVWRRFVPVPVRAAVARARGLG